MILYLVFCVIMFLVIYYASLSVFKHHEHWVILILVVVSILPVINFVVAWLSAIHIYSQILIKKGKY